MKRKTLAVIFEVDPEDYRKYDLKEMGLSARSLNALLRVNIKTVEDLLWLREDIFLKLKGLGEKSYSEIIEKIRTILNTQPKSQDEYTYENAQKLFREHRNEVCEGDFRWYDQLNIEEKISEENQKMLSRCRQAQIDLGIDLAKIATFHTESVSPIYNMLKDYSAAVEREIKLRNMLQICVNRMEQPIRTKRAKPYVCAFSEKENVTNQLNSQIGEDTTFEMLPMKCDVLNATIFQVVQSFINWANFDLHQEADVFFKKLYKDLRNFQIVQMRSRGVTLEAVGKEFNLTRERVRQIESNIMDEFSEFQKKICLLPKLSALKDGNMVLGETDFEEYVPEWSKEIFYFYRTTKSNEFYYMPESDVIVIGNQSVVRKALNHMPDCFKGEDIQSIISNAEKEYDIPRKALEEAIKNSYKITGKIYHKSKIPLETLYNYILNKYYPYGIRVYNDESLNDFRRYVLQEFGDIKFAQSNRTITAKLVEIGIQYDRGVYRAKKEQYLSPQLIAQIKIYIAESPEYIISIDTLFSVFKSELIVEGVDNKYYLQSILRETLEYKYHFEKDYLSK